MYYLNKFLTNLLVYSFEPLKKKLRARIIEGIRDVTHYLKNSSPFLGCKSTNN